MWGYWDLGRANTLSVIPLRSQSWDSNPCLSDPKAWDLLHRGAGTTQKSLRRLPRGVISKTSNGPYLPKHQDFARFLHRNTVSDLYLQVSATGSWECKLMGKVTWSLAGISFPHSQRAWPYFWQFWPWGRWRLGPTPEPLKKVNTTKEESGGAQNTPLQLPRASLVARGSREEERHFPTPPGTLW